MELESAFLAAALPEPVTILCHDLLPYSLGHELLLRRLASPFLCGDRKLKPESWKVELFKAVFICSRPYAEALSGIRDPALPAYFAKTRRRAGKFDLEQKLTAFLCYIREGTACPNYRKIRRPGFRTIELDTPLLARLTQHAYSIAGAAAMDMPFGLVHWLYALEIEDRGWIRISTKSGGALFDALRAAAAREGLTPLKFSEN